MLGRSPRPHAPPITRAYTPPLLATAVRTQMSRITTFGQIPRFYLLTPSKRIILSGKIKLVLRTGNGPTQLRFGASSPADPAPARTGVATFDPSGSVRRVSFDSAGKWGGGLADTAAGVSPFGGAPAFTRFAAAPTMPDNATTVLVPSGTALDLGAKLVLRGKVNK